MKANKPKKLQNNLNYFQTIKTEFKIQIIHHLNKYQFACQNFFCYCKEPIVAYFEVIRKCTYKM